MLKPSSNRLKKFVALAVFCFIIFFSLPDFCFADCPGNPSGHHHHEHVTSPSFKYTKDANINPKKGQLSSTSLWIEALSATLIISIFPFLILFFLPLNNNKEHASLLKVLLSLAAGGLLGDAFLHLIPHALVPHSHHHAVGEHHHHHEEDAHDNNIGLWVLSGIIMFLVVEKFVRIVKGEHSHSHGTENKISDPVTPIEECYPRCVDCPEKGADEMSKSTEKLVTENEKIEEKDTLLDDSSDSEEIKVAGYLNLVADFTHNFTDGLAIGASFLAGEKVGLVTTVTILLHEIPHEIGDFAILVQSGCSKKKAMLLQLTTALGALSGTIVSLYSGGRVDENTGSWVLPFTAGGFIYIATVSIIPDLLADSNFVQSAKEVAALLVGVLLMVLVAKYE